MAMFKELYLIRHGKTQANVDRTFVGQTDSPLLPENAELFLGIGEFLKQEAPFDLCYGSPLGRVTQSYEMMGLSHELILDERLMERHYGQLEGLHINDFPEGFQKQYRADPHHTVFPDGESYAQMMKRVEAFYAELLPSWENKRVLIHAHWGTNSLLAALILGKNVAWADKWLQPNNVIYRFGADKQMDWKMFGESGWQSWRYIAEQ